MAKLGNADGLEDRVEHGRATRGRCGRGLLFWRRAGEVGGAEHRESTSHGGAINGHTEALRDGLELVGVGADGEDALAVLYSEVVGEVVGGLLELSARDDNGSVARNDSVERIEDLIQANCDLCTQGLRWLRLRNAVLCGVGQGFEERAWNGLAKSGRWNWSFWGLRDVGALARGAVEREIVCESLVGFSIARSGSMKQSVETSGFGHGGGCVMWILGSVVDEKLRN